jgi:CBS domain-containing protein
VAARFNGALIELGYPPCPGEIMLTNPLWRQPLAGFARRSATGSTPPIPGPDAPRDLLRCGGGGRRQGSARRRARPPRRHLRRHDAFLARFASAVDQFSDGGWWSWLTTRRDDTQLDLKKIGTFPIVHGVRVLALQHRAGASSARPARSACWSSAVAIDGELARDLVDALHCLMAMKLTHQLRQRAAGEVPGNLVRPADLGSLERDALNHALAIVKRFRALLAQRYRLDAL